jgi:hypothetical protein
MVKRLLSKTPVRKRQTTNVTRHALTVPPPLREIPQGLLIFENIFSDEILLQIISEINEQTWDTRFRKRMQHYGYFFNHAKNRLEIQNSCSVIDGLYNYFQMINLANFNMCSVEEYLPGMSSQFSIESLRYGSIIAIINLGGEATFTFRRRGYENQRITLGNCSLLILRDEARTFWQYQIEENVEKRIQLIFRQVPGDQI